MAVAVEWPVIPGGHYVKIRVPGRALPVSLPGTPSDRRAMTNIRKLLERCGLQSAYNDMLSRKEEERRSKLTAVKARATRKLASATPDEAPVTQQDQLAQLLVEGIAKGMTIGFEVITPEMARALTSRARAAIDEGGFRQRHATQRIVDEFSVLMKHGEWTQYLPDGVIGIDKDGVLINGQKRMLAVDDANVSIGFVVARNVPREMFPFFDRAQTRTAAHVFEIDGLPSGPDYASTIRLAMRYEEMLRNVRDPATWGNWAGIRDTVDESLDFYRRHADIADSVMIGRALGYGAKIVPAAGAVFHYYADKAWPDRKNDAEGYDPLDSFISRLQTGEHMARNHPAMVLRDWTKDTYREEKVQAKRETHLFLLLKHWSMHVTGLTVPGAQVKYQRIWAMPVPHHPDGKDAAVRNIFGLKK